MDRFEFDGLREEAFTDVTLSNTERAALREYAAPGAALWRIMKAALDYRRHLERSLAQADLLSPQGLETARAVQGEMRAVQWMYEMWERLLSMPDEAPETKVNEVPND